MPGPHRTHIPDPPQGCRPRHRDRRRLPEGQAHRLGYHLVCLRARVLGERAPAEAEHLVAGPQSAHVRAGCLHASGRVDPGHPGLRLGQPHFPHEPPDERVASHDVPVVRVERGGVHPHQYVAGADPGPVGVHQLEDVRRAEPLLDNRLHQVTPCRRALSR